MGENGLTVADALALRNGGNNGGIFGGGDSAWVVLILILLLAGGRWGNNFGGNDGNGTNTVVVPTGGFGGWSGGYSPCCSPATAQGMSDAFNFSALNQGITSTHDSVVDGFYQNNLATTNLGTAYKLIDIYKDIKEADYYKKMSEESETYDARRRDSRGRYMGDDRDDNYDARGGRDSSGGRYSHYYPWGDREERYFDRMREGMDNYSEGRGRYRDGSSQEKMIDGIELAMTALVSFVETLYDHAETTKEKDVIKEHIEKLKRI